MSRSPAAHQHPMDAVRCVAGGDETVGDRQAGSTWPAVPPPVTTAETTGRVVRATFGGSPAPARQMSSELPPKEMNGSVSPVTGMTPVTPPMLMVACRANQMAMPRRATWRSDHPPLHVEGHVDTEPGEQGETADDGDDADETEFLRRDGSRR